MLTPCRASTLCKRFHPCTSEPGGSVLISFRRLWNFGPLRESNAAGGFGVQTPSDFWGDRQSPSGDSAQNHRLRVAGGQAARCVASSDVVAWIKVRASSLRPARLASMMAPSPVWRAGGQAVPTLCLVLSILRKTCQLSKEAPPNARQGSSSFFAPGTTGGDRLGGRHRLTGSGA